MFHQTPPSAAQRERVEEMPKITSCFSVGVSAALHLHLSVDIVYNGWAHASAVQISSHMSYLNKPLMMIKVAF